MRFFGFVFFAVCGVALAAQAAEKSTEPVPRFVSLRADTVNLRTGPGSRYPIEFVYHRKGYPLEIVAEFDQWRQVRDWQGTEGWVHQRMVTGTRNVVIQGAQRILRQAADNGAAPVAKLDPGVIAHLLECRDAWCLIEVPSAASDVRGWLGRGEIWGVLPNEVVK
ncbi:MAG TPA: SH3 domain-containing protein [Stellaceae bacterium]|nr:SH3 domain-containing protein [Stellaceae bacterium]